MFKTLIQFQSNRLSMSYENKIILLKCDFRHFCVIVLINTVGYKYINNNYFRWYFSKKKKKNTNYIFLGFILKHANGFFKSRYLNF